jgi:ferredoxin
MACKITDKCEACGNCMGECPQGAISSGKPYKIDADACVDCGACESACPSGAIISDV